MFAYRRAYPRASRPTGNSSHLGVSLEDAWPCLPLGPLCNRQMYLSVLHRPETLVRVDPTLKRLVEEGRVTLQPKAHRLGLHSAREHLGTHAGGGRDVDMEL